MKIEKRIKKIEDEVGHIVSDVIPNWAITEVQGLMKAQNRVCKAYGRDPAYTEEDIYGETALQRAKALAKSCRTLEEYHRRSIIGLADRLEEALKKTQ